MKKNFRRFKTDPAVHPNEEKIKDTVNKSMEIFYLKEQEKLLTYREFLWMQFRITQKRWWLFQTLLLTGIGIILSLNQEEFYIQRGLGITSVLFVILIIPELWKNKSNQCMEIESASYYSLRQIYSARIFLFGLVDVLLLTVFCLFLHGRLHITLLSLLSQFLFPAVTTACICFGMLCSKRNVKGIRPIVAKNRVKELTAKVGLQKAVNKKMKTLSGGMKRRVGIAQAMLNDPKILILDEPTAGLDPNERIRFRKLISELAEERLVLLSTHIVSDIEYIANEIWLLKDGKLMHKGSAEEVINSMPENVWECCVGKNEVSCFMNKYKISNMKTEANGVMLRIISLEKPVENAKSVETSLEDVFLYYFGEKAGNENVEI